MNQSFPCGILQKDNILNQMIEKVQYLKQKINLFNFYKVI